MQLPSKPAAHQTDEVERQLLLQLLQVLGGLVGQPPSRPPCEGLQEGASAMPSVVMSVMGRNVLIRVSASCRCQ